MSSSRGGFGGIAIVFLLAVFAFAVLLVLSAATPAAGASGAPSPTGARPPLLTGANIPSQYRLHLGSAVALTDLGSTPVPPSTLSAPGPGPKPADAPFGANLAVTADPAPEHRPTEARDSQGRTYIAFQHQVTPTNHDLYVSWSDDDGRTWSPAIAVASSSADETNPSIIVTSGDRVTIFLQQDANPSAFAYVQSADRGGSWNTLTIGVGTTPVMNFQFPSFVPYLTTGAGAIGMYGVFCTSVTSCSGGAWSVFILWTNDISSPSGWTGVYFAQPNNIEIYHPAAGFNSVTGDLVGALEIEVFDNTAWDLAWFRFNPVTNFFTQDGNMCGTFCPSNTFVWPAIAVDGNRIVTGAHFFNTSLVPYNEIEAVFSSNGGNSYGLVNANSGMIDNAAVDKKYLSLDIKGTQVQAAYWKSAGVGNAATWFVQGINSGATFQSPVRVSDNTPATSIDQQRGIVVRNSTAGPLIAWHDSRDGNPNIYFASFQRYTITIQTVPANLLVRFDNGAYAASPVTAQLPSGTSHTIQAQSPQSGGPSVQYVFTQWNDGSTVNPKTISVSADTTYTATLATQFQITVASNPTGRTVTVGGGPRTAPYNFWCNMSATASIGAPSPQTVSPTSQYRFNSWSDLGAPTHMITCDQPKIVTANFVLQFQVTIATNPAGRDVLVDNVLQTGPYVFWCDNMTSHPISAPSPQATTPGTQYRFDTWSDLGAQGHSITCTGSTTITANFVLQYQLTILTNPTGRDVRVEGTTVQGPYAAYYDISSNVGLLVPSPQASGATARFSFSAWSDGNPNPNRIVVMDGVKSLTAVFTTEYYLTISSIPVGTTNPGNGWHPADDIVSITTTGPAPLATERYTFERWTGDVIWYASSLTVQMDRPITLTAHYIHQFKIDITSNAQNPSITVDGTLRTLPIASQWWNESSSHTLVASTPVPGSTADDRWSFGSWPGGAVGNPTLNVVVSNSATLTATYTHQFRITLVTSPGSGPNITEGNKRYTGTTQMWWDEGSTHTLDAGPSPQSGGTGVRYVFQTWDSSFTAALRPYTVSQAATLTATYKKQFLLTIDSPHAAWTCVNSAGTQQDGCWYESGLTATVTVTSPFQDGGTKYVFTGWSGDGSGQSTSVQVTMNDVKTLRAGWREVTFLEEFGVYLGLLIGIIVAIVLVLLFLLMRRRKKEPAPAPPAAAPIQGARAPPAGGTKTCPACGMEIPGAASTCPVCGSAV